MAQGDNSKFMILFDTATSPDGKFLVACSTFGDIFIWNIASVLNTKHSKVMVSDINHSDSFDDDDSDNDLDIKSNAKKSSVGTSNPITKKGERNVAKHLTPTFVFHPSRRSNTARGPIYRLKTVGDLLCVGSFDCLILYQWKDIIAEMSDVVDPSNPSLDLHSIYPEPVHRYTPPQIEYALGAKSQFVEINAIDHDPTKNCLYLGTGHSSIFRFDLGGSHSVNVLKGHKEYVLDLSVKSNHGLMSSSSDDGTLKLWDLRHDQCVHTFYGGKLGTGSPSQDNRSAYFSNCCQLHENGKYVVSGFGVKQLGNGRNKMCIFELNMRTQIAEFISDQNLVPQVARFSSEWRVSKSNLAVVVGYNDRSLKFHDKMAGNVGIETSSKSVWSIKYESSKKAMFVCGASNKIDCIAGTGNITKSLTV